MGTITTRVFNVVSLLLGITAIYFRNNEFILSISIMLFIFLCFMTALTQPKQFFAHYQLFYIEMGEAYYKKELWKQAFSIVFTIIITVNMIFHVDVVYILLKNHNIFRIWFPNAGDFLQMFISFLIVVSLMAAVYFPARKIRAYRIKKMFKNHRITTGSLV